MDGVPARHEPAARVGASTPVEFAGVARDHRDLARIAPESLGDDLGEGRVMSLSLRGQARGHQHAAARLDSYMRAFVRTIARALDVVPDDESYVTWVIWGIRMTRAERREASALECELQYGVVV